MPANARKAKVLCAMSGGVDSSVAAALLAEAGYEVVGVFMRLGSPGESFELAAESGPEACDTSKIGHRGCCSVGDAADARLVAAQLGIPFYVANFKQDFGRIMDYFAAEYLAGRTPNPCVRCNDWLKFGRLHEYAAQIGADFVASGHYAQVVADGDGRPALLRGVDADKDQSYVLFGVAPTALGQMLLPVGGMQKPAVRERALRLGLPVFDKPDSQEICFVPDDDYAGFVERRRPGARREGAILDPAGRVVGRHDGQHRYTIGQRRRVGVALGYPVYVVSKDTSANTVTIGPRELLESSGCRAAEANWLIPEAASRLADWTPCWAQHRYNSDPQRAEVRVLPAAESAGSRSHSGREGRFAVRFAEAQTAVTPGQAIVVYGPWPGEDGPRRVWGGGWIESAVSGTEA